MCLSGKIIYIYSMDLMDIKVKTDTLKYEGSSLRGCYTTLNGK